MIAWVPTSMSISPCREAGEDVLALLALLAAGQDRDAHAGALGQRRDRLQMLARENFGRRHQCRLLAGFRDGGGSQQRDHRLARADVALQQPQHPQRLAEVAGDGSGRLLLRGRQRVGQCVDDLSPQMPVAGVAHAGRPAKLGPHQRQRQLARQQFVIGEPLPERLVGQDVVQLLRDVNARQRLGERREASCAG